MRLWSFSNDLFCDSVPYAYPLIALSPLYCRDAIARRIRKPAGKERSNMGKAIPALFLLSLMTGAVMAQEPTVTSLMEKGLTDNPGKEVMMITVQYAPGGSDPKHRHNAQTVLYVLEGSVVMQVRGGEQARLTPGLTFYEGADDVHIVGGNSSDTNPAKFLV